MVWHHWNLIPLTADCLICHVPALALLLGSGRLLCFTCQLCEEQCCTRVQCVNSGLQCLRWLLEAHFMEPAKLFSKVVAPFYLLKFCLRVLVAPHFRGLGLCVYMYYLYKYSICIVLFTFLIILFVT